MHGQLLSWRIKPFLECLGLMRAELHMDWTNDLAEKCRNVGFRNAEDKVKQQMYPFSRLALIGGFKLLTSGNPKHESLWRLVASARLRKCQMKKKISG